MKKAAEISAAVAAVLLLFSLLVAALNVIFCRTGWLYGEYSEKLTVDRDYGISAEDASRVLSRMMYYSIGRADDLDVSIVEDGREVAFFNESELSHMRDVRKLTRTVMALGMTALGISALTLITLAIARRTDALRVYAKAFLITLAVVAVIVIALGVWVAVDFDSFWTVFHIVFLDLESSTFDPAVSRMIRICPGELFSDFIVRFALYGAAFVGSAAVISAVFLAAARKKHD